MHNPSKIILTAVLTTLLMVPAPAQERGETAVASGQEPSGIAAFDFQWLALYYGFCQKLPAYIKESVPSDGKAPDDTGGQAEGQTGRRAPFTGEHTLKLRTNLLRWATLTPDLGIEWRISPSVGIMVNGSWTSWSRNNAARRYALWEVAPEARWYLGEARRWYVGAMFKAGQFNYKLSGTGRQGDLLGGGITGGYQLRLNKALALDFTLGLGYLNADTEKYEVIEGVRVRSGNETKHWIGPINAGVTLVWKLF